jgi:hypothetical protein
VRPARGRGSGSTPTASAARSASSLVRIQRETVLERLPLALPVGRRRWQAAVDRLAASGAGVALFAPADGAPVDDAAVALLAAHLPARARPLVGLHARLARHGVALEPAVRLDAAA